MALVTNDTGKEDDLVKAGGEAPRASPVNTVRLYDPEYKVTPVDTRWTPHTNLLVHIEGYAWVVDYYAQVINADSQLSGQQLSVSAVYQQYTKIVSMEMRVNNPLTSSQDGASKSMVLSGVATTYPFLIPNEGDMFVADIGQGKRGVFRITASVKKSIFKEACYEITYDLDTDKTDKLLDLNQKTVKTVYFHKDFLSYGQSPLLIPGAHAALLELERVYDTLTRQYFRKFFSHEFQTLLVPGQAQTTYDPFLVNFMLSQFSTWDCPEITKIRRLNVDDDKTMRCDSLWKALQEKESMYLDSAFKQAGLVSAGLFTANPVFEGIRYTGIDQVVYPIDPVLTVDGLDNGPRKLLAATRLIQPNSGQGLLSEMVHAINTQALAPRDTLVHPVAQDNCYVLSQAFYDKSEHQSVLESLVWAYLDGLAIDVEQLVATAKRHTTWGVLEQFYYVPIIMVLLRGTKRGM
jgi:hypothetical protein